ncbi:MAG: serine/threonine protein kinase, partial [bacterium]|nr:serine/threonine protein kinase [bacterium]
MNPKQRWERISELFNVALDLPADKRRSFLEDTGDDTDLLREVEEMLDAEEWDEAFLARPFFSLREPSDDDDPELGRNIGPYRLVRRIGRGGMGKVFRAERVDGELEQEVAVKLLRSSVETDEILRRFRAERQILAELDHPNVVRLLDAGTTGDGLPYLVMEPVEGRPIDEHCDALRLPVRERVRLFRSVCAAVSFAHRHLVVHRDLKPENILVTAAGRIKLLDFGVAKLLRNDPGFLSTATRQPAPMTLRYASPEQVRDGPITTASDVYSLGVILYELLSGHRAHRYTTSDPREVARAVCDETPPRPSTAVAGDAEACRRRGADPRRLRRQLAGDLDKIVMTALRKEPERRFSSAEQLSEDLRRYLEGLPVRSRPDTFAYRAGKFVRRHAWGVAAVAAIVALILIFAVSTTLQSAEIVRQSEEITRERDRARNVTRFLVDVLGTSDPRRARGHSPTVRETLDDAVARLETDLRDEPRIRAALLDAIGVVYRSQGIEEQARPLLEEALKLRREHLDADDPVLAESLHNLAGLEHGQRRYEEAEALMREAIAIQRRAFPGDHRDLARGLSNLAAVALSQRRLDQAEALARESLTMKQRLFGGDDVEVAVSLNLLAAILTQTEKIVEAEALYRRTLEIRRRAGGPDDPGVATALNNLATLLVDHTDRLDEALPLHRQALRIRRQVYDGDHRHLVSSLNNLALLLTTLGEHEEAGALFDEA